MMKNLLFLFGFITLVFNTNAQNFYCIESQDNTPPPEHIPLGDTIIDGIDIPGDSSTCFKSRDTDFFRTGIGSMLNYIPWADNSNAKNVKKKVKVKFVVTSFGVPNDNTIKPFYEDQNTSKFYDYVDEINFMLSSIVTPLSKAPILCQNELNCHIEKTKIKVELVDVAFIDTSFTQNKINNKEDKDSILYVVFKYDTTNTNSNGFASPTKKIMQNKDNSISHNYIFMQNLHKDNFSTDSSKHYGGRLFIHELGHLFSLEHLYEQDNRGQSYETCDENHPDYLLDIFGKNIVVDGIPYNKWCAEDNPNNFECDYTDPNTICTNNFMDNAGARYFSPMQMGRMHREAYLGNISRYIYPVDEPHVYPWYVSEDETWDYAIRLYQNLIVESGTKLTIKCTVYMPPNGKIIVEPGGQLIIDGGIITSYHENARWAGVQLEGNKNLEPLFANQGAIEMKNGAMIERAQNGIRNFRLQNGAQGGGIIQVKDSRFKNCLRAVELNDYPNHSYFHNGQSYCSFDNVKFIIDDTVAYHDNANVKEFFTAFNIKGGIHIKNSLFENKLDQETIAQEYRNSGIYLLSSYAYITNNKFYGLFNAVKNDTHINTPQRNILLRKNDFQNNSINVFLSNTSNNNIKENEITNLLKFDLDFMGSTIPLYSVGVMIRNNKGTLINCNNKIDGLGNDITGNHRKYGIVSEEEYSMRGANNIIKSNDLNSLMNAIQTQKYSRKFQVLCNEMSNNEYAFNINPESDTYFMNNLGTGCDPFNQTRANNVFISNDLDIISNVNIPWKYYYWDNNPSFIPTSTGTVITEICGTTNEDPNSQCDNLSDCIFYIDLGNTQIENLKAEYHNLYFNNSGNSANELSILENTIVNAYAYTNQYEKVIEFYEGLKNQAAYEYLVALYYESKDYINMYRYIDSLTLDTKEKTNYYDYYSFLENNIDNKGPNDGLSNKEIAFLNNFIASESVLAPNAKALLNWYDDNNYESPYIEELNSTPFNFFVPIEDKEYVKLELFPNPAQKDVQIIYELYNFDKSEVFSELKIFDIMGREVYSIEKEGEGYFREKLDVSTWANGLYIYTLEVEGKQIKTGKLIIVK